ncbi:MAG: tetratricopeptide repeat protein [Acidobacteriota bacterium]
MKWKRASTLLVVAVLTTACGPRKPPSVPGDAPPTPRAEGTLPGDEHIKNPEVAYNMALEFAGQRNFEAAHHYIALASRMEPQAKYSYADALFYLSESRFTEALAKLEAALRQGPGTSENRVAVLNAMGVCHMQLNQDEQALTVLREVVNTPGMFSRYESYYNMGVIYMRQNKLMDAEAVFIKVVEENPRYHRGYNKLGMLAAAKGKWSDAALYFKKAIDLLSNNYEGLQSDGAEIYFHYGEALYQEKLYPQARAALLEVLKIAPEGPFGQSAKRILQEMGEGR